MSRLTRDPELRYTQGGTAHCRFTLAVDHGLSEEKQEEAREKGLPMADFISCRVWGETTGIISNYIAKGHLFSISGTIQIGRYERDGHTVYTTNIVVRSFDFIQARVQESPGQTTEDTGQGFCPVDNGDISF